MIKAIICDRCGQEFSPDEIVCAAFVTRLENDEAQTELDLCTDCAIATVKFASAAHPSMTEAW